MSELQLPTPTLRRSRLKENQPNAIRCCSL